MQIGPDQKPRHVVRAGKKEVLGCIVDSRGPQSTTCRPAAPGRPEAAALTQGSEYRASCL